MRPPQTGSRGYLHVYWRSHTSNAEQYDDLSNVSPKVQQRRMRLAAHCIKHGDEHTRKLVLCCLLNKRRTKKGGKTHIRRHIATDGNGTRTEDHHDRQCAKWKEPVYASGHIPVNDLNLVYSSIMVFLYTFECLLFDNEYNICPKVFWFRKLLAKLVDIFNKLLIIMNATIM